MDYYRPVSSWMRLGLLSSLLLLHKEDITQSCSNLIPVTIFLLVSFHMPTTILVLVKPPAQHQINTVYNSTFLMTGTVVDTKICHPLYNNNFYICAHAARVVSISLKKQFLDGKHEATLCRMHSPIRHSFFLYSLYNVEK